MGIAVVERNALLEQVWDLQTVRDYVAIVDLLGELPLTELQQEPELGVTLCYAWYQLGEFNRSVSLIQQLEEACERRGNTRLARRRMNNEALIRIIRGELDIAERILQNALVRGEEAGDIQFTAWTHNNLGILYSTREMWDFSISHYRRSIVAGQRLGDIRHISLCYLNSGITHYHKGDYKLASTYLASAAELSQDVGSESELAHIELALAYLQESEGDHRMASATCQVAKKRFRQLGNRKGEGGILHIRARIALKHKRVDRAKILLEHAIACCETASFRAGEAEMTRDLAEIYYTEGDMQTFSRLMQRSISTYAALGNSFQVMRLQTRTAEAKAKQSDIFSQT